MEARVDGTDKWELWSRLHPEGRAQHLGDWFSSLEDALEKINLPDESKEYASILLQRLRPRKETAVLVEGLAVSVALACTFIAIFIGPIVLGVPVWRGPVTVVPALSWVVNIAVYLALTIAVYGISAFPGLRGDDSEFELLETAPDSGISSSWKTFAGSWTVVSLGAIFFLGRQLSDNTENYYLRSFAMTLSAAAISVATYYVLTLVINVPILIWLASKERKWQSSLVESLLVQDLLLAWSEANNEWKDLEQRVRVAAHLERTAGTLENGLARRFRPDDAITKDWLTNELRRKAAAIRQLKQNVYFPSGRGQQLILDKCQGLLSCILTGDWNSLPSADIEPPKQDSLMTRLRRLGQRLFNAFLPLLVLLGLRGRVSIASTTSTYLWTFAIAWAVLGVLMTTDPAIRGKVQVLRDSTDAIRSLQ
jgi:hypothetical protein